MLTMVAVMCVTGLARDPDGFTGVVPLPPPEANPLEVEVPRGGPVWITLSAYSLTSQITRYRIRRPTKAGKLGTPQLVTASTGRVRYTPPAGTGPGEDSFAYAVQSEAGVSAAAEVEIKITDKEPQVITPDELDYGDVLPGKSASKELVMENIGGGLAQGEVRVPEPWTVRGDAAYRLGGGEKQSFTIIFKPQVLGPFTGDVEYTGDLERATDLKGNGVAAIGVEEGPVELAQAGNIRIGTIHVENRTDQARTLQVRAGPLLVVDGTINVPANGGTDIVVTPKENGDGELRDHVTVEGEGVQADVVVHGAAALVARPTPAGIPIVRRAPVDAGRNRVQAQVAAEEDALLPEMMLPPMGPDLADVVTWPPRVPVMALQLEQTGDQSTRLGCNFAGAAQARSYRLETQTVGVDANGRPEARWVEIPDVAFDVNGQAVTVSLEHPRPNALYMLRVVGLDAAGNMIETSSTRQVWTVQAKSGGYWKWILLAAIAAAGAAVWRRWKQATL